MKVRKIIPLFLAFVLCVTTAPVTMAAGTEDTSFPAKFDLRDRGVVTPVKIQNPWQTCWAFAGTAAAESSILSTLQAKGTPDNAKTFDLSEKHLTWFATQPITKNIEPAQAGEGLHLLSDAQNAVYDTGGMSMFISTLFSSGVGPVYEKYFPYQGSTGLTDKQYLTRYPDKAREKVIEIVEIKLLSGITLEDLAANPDSDATTSYCNYLCEKGYMNREDPLTVELLEEASFQLYLNEYASSVCYTRFDDWSIPELGEDEHPNRNFTSGFTMVDGNILPDLSIRHKDSNNQWVWDAVNPDGIRAVKEELMKGRAVSAGFKADVSAPGQGIPEKSYMNYENWAHYTYEDVPQSHAICIVGWDDNYPAANFPEGHQPAGNGA